MKFSKNIKQKLKPSVTFFNYEYFLSILFRCVILITLTYVLFAEFKITKSNILLIALLDLLVSIYGIYFVFIKPLVKKSQRYDLSSLDSDHFKSAFLKLFKFFSVIYLFISIIPNALMIFLCLFPDAGAKEAGFFYFNEILINVFSIIKDFLWIKIADSFIKSNFDLIKNKYKKFIFTPAVFILILLFASCSIATTYFKSFKSIATDTLSNSTSNIEEPIDSDEPEYVSVQTGLNNADTTLVYSRNEIYTVDSTLNRIICYENEDYKTAKVVYEFENTEYIKFKDIDFVYKYDDLIYFCYPSKNTRDFTKAGLYSINLTTKEYTLIIDDIINYNFSGKKLSNTFDCVTSSYPGDYSIFSYDYINTHLKNVQTFALTDSQQYSIKKSGDNFYLQLYSTKNSQYYINGQPAFNLKQSLVSQNNWFALNNYLFVLEGTNIYKINSQSPFESISKITDINLNEFINRFYYDSSFTNLNPPIAERYKFIFSLNYETLENKLVQSSHRAYSNTLPFDGSYIELYDFNDSLVITYNKANNIIAYNRKNDFTIARKKVINDSHFIEFDIENNPYIIESQSLKQFRYNENSYNKNTVK